MSDAASYRPEPKPAAVTWQFRILAAVTKRFFESKGADIVGGRVIAGRSQGALVIVADGGIADRIEGELLRQNLLSYVQHDEKVRPRP